MKNIVSGSAISAAFLAFILSGCGHPVLSLGSGYKAPPVTPDTPEPSCTIADTELAFNPATDEDCLSNPDGEIHKNYYTFDANEERLMAFVPPAGKVCYQKRFYEVITQRLQKIFQSLPDGKSEQTVVIGNCNMHLKIYGFNKTAWEVPPGKDETGNNVGRAQFENVCSYHKKRNSKSGRDLYLAKYRYDELNGISDADLKKTLFGNTFTGYLDAYRASSSSPSDKARGANGYFISELAMEAYIDCADMKE